MYRVKSMLEDFCRNLQHTEAGTHHGGPRVFFGKLSPQNMLSVWKQGNSFSQEKPYIFIHKTPKGAIRSKAEDKLKPLNTWLMQGVKMWCNSLRGHSSHSNLLIMPARSPTKALLIFTLNSEISAKYSNTWMLQGVNQVRMVKQVTRRISTLTAQIWLPLGVAYQKKI